MRWIKQKLGGIKSGGKNKLSSVLGSLIHVNHGEEAPLAGELGTAIRIVARS